MKIGVIGTGQIGATLIRQYTTAGLQVKMTNATGLDKLRPLAEETGARAVDLEECIKHVDAIIVAIPLVNIIQLPRGLFRNTTAPVVDTCNYYPIRDGRIDEIENGMPESVWMSHQIGHPVIKAYNSILAGSLIESSLPRGASGRLALPISGNDQKEKDIVSKLIDASGFDAVDIGSLKQSWKQQPGSPIYCTDLTVAQLQMNLRHVEKELLPGRRELALEFIMQQDQSSWLGWWRQCRDNNRRVYDCSLSAVS